MKKKAGGGLKTKAALMYSLGDLESGLMTAINQATIGDPTQEATARLVRDQSQVFMAWMEAEGVRHTDATSIIIAAMHGVLTISGSFIVNLPADERRAAHLEMRSQMLEMYDAMWACVKGEP